MNRMLRVVASILSLGALACTARAELANYNLQMTVTSADAGAFGGVVVGQNFTATVTFDTATPNPQLPTWQDGTDFFVDLNDTIFDQSVYEATIPSSLRTVLVAANTNSGSVFPIDDPYGFKDLIIRLNCYSSLDTSLVDPSLPGIAISGVWDDDLTWGAQQTTGERVTGTFSVVLVPEPCTLSLLGLGSLALMVGRRRKSFLKQ